LNDLKRCIDNRLNPIDLQGQKTEDAILANPNSLIRGGNMKKLTLLIFTVLTLGASVSSQAHGFGHFGGGHGYVRGGYYGGWGVPFVAGALVGSAAYAATYPAYSPVYVNPPVVVNPAPVYQASPGAPVAYYCPSYQQYYPQVATCPVPWQPVQ
jgi:hypothetical protein